MLDVEELIASDVSPSGAIHVRAPSRREIPLRENGRVPVRHDLRRSFLIGFVCRLPCRPFRTAGLLPGLLRYPRGGLPYNAVLEPARYLLGAHARRRCADAALDS